MYVSSKALNDPLILLLNSYPATGNICHMTYVDSAAPDQPTHLHSLIRELHCLLISQPFLQISKQSKATLSSYGI